MNHLRGNFGRWFEHKPPPRHTWMRNDQIGIDPREVVIEQQIEVDGPRLPKFGALSTQIGFDLL
jgi:hypothetical protein